jgi:hypothetical protein
MEANSTTSGSLKMKSNTETNTGCLTYNNIRSNGLGDLVSTKKKNQKKKFQFSDLIKGTISYSW